MRNLEEQFNFDFLSSTKELVSLEIYDCGIESIYGIEKYGKLRELVVKVGKFIFNDRYGFFLALYAGLTFP